MYRFPLSAEGPATSMPTLEEYLKVVRQMDKDEEGSPENLFGTESEMSGRLRFFVSSALTLKQDRGVIG